MSNLERLAIQILYLNQDLSPRIGPYLHLLETIRPGQVIETIDAKKELKDCIKEFVETLIGIK